MTLFRVVYAMEQFVTASDESEAREKWRNDEVEVNPYTDSKEAAFCYVLAVEAQEEEPEELPAKDAFLESSKWKRGFPWTTTK